MSVVAPAVLTEVSGRKFDSKHSFILTGMFNALGDIDCRLKANVQSLLLS